MTDRDPWADVLAAARLFAHAPAGTGMHLRARHGPVRDHALALIRAALPPGTPWRLCPAGIADDRLLGGLDLGATLARTGAVFARGVLAEASGGVVVVRGAERVTAALAARLAAVLDTGMVVVERDGFSLRQPAQIGLLLLDEGEDDLPAALRERLATRLDLDAISPAAPMPAMVLAASMGAHPAAPDEISEALCSTCHGLGIAGGHAPVLALRFARAAAAVDGRDTITADDAALAARLVLAHRATRLPLPPDAETAPEQASPEPNGGHDEGASEDFNETVLAAAVAALPPALLASLSAAASGARSAHQGRAPGRDRAALRGRPTSARPGRPEGAARLDLVATLQAAAPWQRLRRTPGRTTPVFRASDLRVRRRRARPRATTLFVVDASGSAALHRLAEAKGAVELLLTDCYVRRDQVALLAFRGTAAELLLPPTGALTRARRCLGALPGGGGTPLAAALRAAGTLAQALQRRGETPLLVLLTDGRANVALDGTVDRPRAASDTAAEAARLRQSGVPALVIDISPRPGADAPALAVAMGARCLPMPRADAAALTRAVRAAA